MDASALTGYAAAWQGKTGIEIPACFTRSPTVVTSILGAKVMHLPCHGPCSCRVAFMSKPDARGAGPRRRGRGGKGRARWVIVALTDKGAMCPNFKALRNLRGWTEVDDHCIVHRKITLCPTPTFRCGACGRRQKDGALFDRAFAIPKGDLRHARRRGRQCNVCHSALDPRWGGKKLYDADAEPPLADYAKNALHHVKKLPRHLWGRVLDYSTNPKNPADTTRTLMRMAMFQKDAHVVRILMKAGASVLLDSATLRPTRWIAETLEAVVEEWFRRRVIWTLCLSIERLCTTTLQREAAGRMHSTVSAAIVPCVHWWWCTRHAVCALR